MSAQTPPALRLDESTADAPTGSRSITTRPRSDMHRLIRPMIFMTIAIAAAVAFALAGRLSPATLDWRDIGGWADRTEPADALAELARGTGLVLAIYVGLVSAAALLAEIASVIRLPRLNHMLRHVVAWVALPALRRRLLELTTVVTMTAASLHAAPTRAAYAAAAPITLVTGTAPLGPAPAVRGEFQGFGTTPLPSEPTTPVIHTVRAGDTLCDIIRARYGRADDQLLELVVAANAQITDPDFILVGWTITLPDLSAPPVAPAPVPPVEGEATWTVVTVQPGESLWEIVELRVGVDRRPYELRRGMAVVPLDDLPQTLAGLHPHHGPCRLSFGRRYSR